MTPVDSSQVESWQCLSDSSQVKSQKCVSSRLKSKQFIQSAFLTQTKSNSSQSKSFCLSDSSQVKKMWLESSWIILPCWLKPSQVIKLWLESTIVKSNHSAFLTLAKSSHKNVTRVDSSQVESLQCLSDSSQVKSQKLWLDSTQVILPFWLKPSQVTKMWLESTQVKSRHSAFLTQTKSTHNKNVNDVALIRHLATSNIANFMWYNFSTGQKINISCPGKGLKIKKLEWEKYKFDAPEGTI